MKKNDRTLFSHVVSDLDVGDTFKLAHQMFKLSEIHTPGSSPDKISKVNPV